MAFEALFGIRMNFEKIEMHPINLNYDSTLDQIFKCKWVSFPIQYLGLPLSDHNLHNNDWNFLIDKVESKLQH